MSSASCIFLTVADFKEINTNETSIKDRLQKPPSDYYIYTLSEDIQNWYMKKFEKSIKQYDQSSNLWFSYYDGFDIEKWIRVIEPMIHTIIYDFEQTEY